MAYETGITIANYVTFLNSIGEVIGNRSYQNFHIAETRTWEGRPYKFAPFGFNGEQISSGAETTRASLVAQANRLTQAVFSEAALAKPFPWMVEVKYVLITPTEGALEPTWAETTTIATEVWVCVGYAASRPDGAVQLDLASPLDAVEATTPLLYLRDWMVGSLPVTGSILLS
jgi:hypothetical protein